MILLQHGSNRCVLYAVTKAYEQIGSLVGKADTIDDVFKQQLAYQLRINAPDLMRLPWHHPPPSYKRHAPHQTVAVKQSP